MHAKADLLPYLQKAYLDKGLPLKSFDRFLLLFKLLKVQSPKLKFYALLNAAGRAELHRCTPQKIMSNVSECSRLFGIKECDFIAVALKQPTLFYQRPESLKAKVDGSADLLCISSDSFLRAAMVKPTLLYQKPETILKNIENSASFIGISREELIRMSLKWPALFSQKPETLRHNLENAALVLCLPRLELVEAALKCPKLLSQRSETLQSNVRRSANLLGIEETTFTCIALKRPNLFLSKPETLCRKSELLGEFLRSANSELTVTDLFNVSAIVLTYSDSRIRNRTLLARSMTVGSPAAFLSITDAKIAKRQAMQIRVAAPCSRL